MHPMPTDLPAYENKTFSYSTPPNPKWKYGDPVASTELGKQWLEGESAGWKVFDPSKENPLKTYALMISGIVPRPIAFVSTMDENGVHNLAPFSWFNQVSPFPPVVSVCCMNGPPRVKDTANNIRATKAFTVNIISEPFVHSANATSIEAPPEVSEWELSGLTMAPSIHVKPPRVKESAFSMECELLQIVDIEHPATKQKTTTMILGTIKYIHVRNDVLKEDGTVDPAKLKPVARMGDILYSTLGDSFRIPRLPWDEEAQKAHEALKAPAAAN